MKHTSKGGQRHASPYKKATARRLVCVHIYIYIYIYIYISWLIQLVLLLRPLDGRPGRHRKLDVRGCHGRRFYGILYIHYIYMYTTDLYYNGKDVFVCVCIYLYIDCFTRVCFYRRRRVVSNRRPYVYMCVCLCVHYSSCTDDKFTPTKHLTPPPHHSSRPAAAHTDTETPLQKKGGQGP